MGGVGSGPRERPLSRAWRDYLAAFDRALREDTPQAWGAKDAAFTVAMAKSGVDAR